MKEIILPTQQHKESVDLSDVSDGAAIFLKESGTLKGMVVKEDDGWIGRTGGACGISGFYDSRLKCLNDAASYGFTLHVED